MQAPVIYEVTTPVLKIRSSPAIWATAVSGFLMLGQRVMVNPETITDDGVYVWAQHDRGWSAIGRLDSTASYMREVPNSTNKIELSVTWISQLDADSPDGLDCGQAGVVMMFRYYGVGLGVRVKDLCKIIMGRTTAANLVALAARERLALRLYNTATEDLAQTLRDLLDAQRPVILLVNYADLMFPVHLASGANQGYHWLVVIGYDG